MTADRRADRVLLLFDPATTIGDIADPSTWLVEGRAPTADEVDLLSEITVQDINDAVDLLKLERSMSGDAAVAKVGAAAALVRDFLRCLGEG